ncbi:uncharacterized protein LOC116850741 isoform X2 [Odontomachus brunneus]|uniref:uncharacterized protein LOC116850741 isoform X2 n=2 Tax=Odontomachus brunneus TaxID=486640 RepID=UPI0013F1B5DF|nr:uncharacterized protein LOC116850741 isoform X2 [Odontomachus brunneus]
MSIEGIITFDGPYTADKYNQFFNPNVCHVCKLPSKNLIPCNQCYMIFYCSENHERIHKDSHLNFCRNLAKIIDKSDWNLCEDLTKWLSSRTKIITKMTVRKMIKDSIDINVIIFAKSCYKCHRQINLKPCIICFSANYCDDHQMLFNLEHKNICKELLLVLNINIACMKSNLLHLCLRKLEFTKFPDARPYHNMITFINRCRKYNQKLYVENVSEPYHSYARLKSFKQPNVIIILDKNLSSFGTWYTSIPTIIAQKCPLLLTVFNEDKMRYNIKEIEKVTDITRNPLYRKNKFCGCRPYHICAAGRLYYRNSHFFMYL